jgi:hypothetical protein
MNALERKAKHQEGLVFFQQGNFSEAIEIFSDAHMTYGAHVALLADIAISYLQLGDEVAAQNIRHLLEEEYFQASPLLSEDSHVETLIFLSKMRELNKEVASALKALESALEFTEGNFSLKTRVLTELIDLKTRLEESYK